MQYNIRSWRSVDAPHCVGRFVPDTEAIALKQKREGVNTDTFAEWLRQTTNLAVDTEVNIQLGEFTLKKHRVEPIDERFRGFNDFAAVFGKMMANANGGIQCAEVKNTTQRLWVRLVGRRPDLLLWKPDRRTVEKPCGRLYPSRLSSNERWILDAIKPLFDACRCPPEVFEVYLPDTTTQTNATFVRMCVVVKGNGKRSGGATTSNNDDDDIYNTIPPLVPLPMDDHFKELVVIRAKTGNDLVVNPAFWDDESFAIG